jgi:DNA modification methylase
MYKLYNNDNMNLDVIGKYDVIFADFVYENIDFSWLDKYWPHLKEGGIFVGMTDFHSIFELGMKLKQMNNSFLVNHLAWKNEWGNHPKDRFHQCFDDILIFSKGIHNRFYSERVQIDKVTKNKGLNPSGRTTKTATAFVDDICLTTTSKERIKKEDGHLIKWQKPLKLMDRILLPFTDEGDVILDLFMGSGTLGEWCYRNKRNYIGIEVDIEVFKLAELRIQNLEVEGDLPDGNVVQGRLFDD